MSEETKNTPALQGKFGDKLSFTAREAYNMIRTNLTLSLPAKDTARVIGLTSALPQEGKSYTSINIAYALAKNGSSVLLVNADLRRPSLELKTGIAADKGLADFLCGTAPSVGDLLIREVLHGNLTLLPAGSMPPNPSELLGTPAMKRLIEAASKQYDYIIIDLPPVISVTDAIVLGPLMDGVVMVVSYKYSQKKYVRRAMSQLGYAGIKVLGFVYNQTVSGGGGYGGRYGKYRYGHYGKYGYNNYYYYYGSGKKKSSSGSHSSSGHHHHSADSAKTPETTTENSEKES